MRRTVRISSGDDVGLSLGRLSTCQEFRSDPNFRPVVNGVTGSRDMAGKAAAGSGRAERERARYNGARGIGDIEVKRRGKERVSVGSE
jgi:hypothetical protein